MLSRPYAFGCILRLRTSSEFRPGNSVSAHIVLFKIVIAVLQFVYFTYLHYIFAVWSFLPRSTVRKRATHYLL